MVATILVCLFMVGFSFGAIVSMLEYPKAFLLNPGIGKNRWHFELTLFAQN
jgi:hypothetical protein